MTDFLNEIIRNAKNGNERAMDDILRQYSVLVRKRANGLYLIGADRDDLIQEGMVGLFKAVMSYDEKNAASFGTFASLCVDRQMISAIRGANRKKHKILNEYVSLSGAKNEDNEPVEGDVDLPDDEYDPERIFYEEENFAELKDDLGSHMSGLEKSILDMLIEGHTMTFMCNKLGKDRKAIDNGLQRVKRKVRDILRKED
ncbi:MAG: sigma-70 family RNA polymerase sigma factor [Clostridia bacterium]|jgi:RNA polymerase sporulation-specific sigma factor